MRRDDPSPNAHAPRVLVIRPSSLGDIVHALPVVADIRAVHPEAIIDWVAEEAFVPLAALHFGIRAVIPLALRRWRCALLKRETWREVAAFCESLRNERYDAVLDLQEQVKGALVAALSRGPAYGPDRASIREPIATLAHRRGFAIDPRQHLIDRCRKLAAQALDYSIAALPLTFGLRVVPGTSSVIPDAPFVVLLHATSRDDKLWPESRWRELIAHFSRAKLAIVLPWGNAAERERSERLAQGFSEALIPPPMDLPELAGLLDRAVLVCGVDTGLVHLAAALTTPTIALFVSTDATLAGVARTGKHARDLGGVSQTTGQTQSQALGDARGHAPLTAEVIVTADEMLSLARCV